MWHGPIRHPRRHIDKYAAKTYDGKAQMPSKDPKKRLEYQKRWRQNTTPEYNKWLYDRRAFRFWKAEKFEEILELIASGKNVIPPHEVANLWLAEAKQRELDVGLFFDHEQNRPTNDSRKVRRR